MPLDFAGSVTGANQNRLCRDAVSKLHVAIAIADDERAAQVQTVFACGLPQQAWFRLAAFARVFGFVRAIVHRIEARTGGGEFVSHSIVHGLNEELREVAAGDAGLIRDDDDGKITVVEAANGGSGEREDAKTAEVVEVADFVGDGAVAIEEDSGA